MPFMSSQGATNEQIKKIVQETVENINKNTDRIKNNLHMVFVSHSFKEEDLELSAILKNHLEKYNDITAYLAEKEKRYGYIISNKIKEAIRNSFCVVVILTKNSIISASVNQELGYAMGIGRGIIPLVSNEVKDKVGVLLNDVEGEEFTDENFEEKCKIIAEHVSKLPKEFAGRNTAGLSDAYLYDQERGSF